MARCTFIFAGGGTGGHLYPGLAIAAELRALADAAGNVGSARCLFVCSDRALDARILKAAEVEFEPSPAKPIIMRPLGLTRFVASWGRSIRHARAIVARERSAGQKVVVVAMGGFVAAPVVQAARVERVPMLMVNLDAIPGKANRWIAKRAMRPGVGAGCITAAPVTGGFARAWEAIPPIVRREVLAPRDRSECRARLGLDPARPVLMVTGGSQGARSVNEFVVEFARSKQGNDALKAGRWQVLHQTGNDADAAAAEAYRAAGVEAIVQAFTPDMGDWWGAADLAIARSGAGNVAEVWATRTPTLFLPYPFHKDEHQRHNARLVVESGGALLARDWIESARNVREHGPLLAELLAAPDRRAAMRGKLGALGPADGASRVARKLWQVGQAGVQSQN